MNSNKTLLRMPELLEALKPLVSISITSDDIFRLIGTGEIEPLGFIQRIPVFDLGQIGEVAKKLQANREAIAEIGAKKNNKRTEGEDV